MGQRGRIDSPDSTRRTWSIMYRDGRGKLQWEGKFKRKGDAPSRLNSAPGDMECGADTKPRSSTFEQFVRAGYASIINNQLIPHLGKIRVTRLRFEHMEAAVGGMAEDQLAPKMIRNAVMLPSTTLWGHKGRAAFRCGLGIRSPAAPLTLLSM